jgi:hypothetical protein
MNPSLPKQISLKNFDIIRNFVRHTLGCNCPEEVFNDLDLSLATAWQEGPSVKILLVGRRLLICILSCRDMAEVRDFLPPLVRMYRDERDRKGYNRVRIVIAATDPASLIPTADFLFQSLPEVDERMHLHILPNNQLSGIE